MVTAEQERRELLGGRHGPRQAARVNLPSLDLVEHRHVHVLLGLRRLRQIRAVAHDAASHQPIERGGHLVHRNPVALAQPRGGDRPPGADHAQRQALDTGVGGEPGIERGVGGRDPGASSAGELYRRRSGARRATPPRALPDRRSPVRRSPHRTDRRDRRGVRPARWRRERAARQLFSGARPRPRRRSRAATAPPPRSTTCASPRRRPGAPRRVRRPGTPSPRPAAAGRRTARAGACPRVGPTARGLAAARAAA